MGKSLLLLLLRSRAGRKRIVVDRRARPVCVPRLADLCVIGREGAAARSFRRTADAHGHTESAIERATRTTTSVAGRQEEFTDGGFHRTRRVVRDRVHRDPPRIARRPPRARLGRHRRQRDYVGPHEWLLRERLRARDRCRSRDSRRLRLRATRRRGMRPAFAWVPFIRDQRGRFTVASRSKAPFDGAPEIRGRNALERCVSSRVSYVEDNINLLRIVTLTFIFFASSYEIYVTISIILTNIILIFNIYSAEYNNDHASDSFLS